MENNKVLRSLIILVAVVVIIESVIIIGKLGKGEPVVVVKQNTPTVAIEKKEANIELSSTGEWSKGKTNKVVVDLKVSRDMSIDSIDLFVKYDPTKVDITKLNFESGVKPTLNKISKEKGMAIANFYVTDKGGMKLLANSLTRLMTIDAISKIVGPVQFEVATGKSSDGSVTMIIENEKSTEVGLSSLPLTVNVK